MDDIYVFFVSYPSDITKLSNYKGYSNQRAGNKVVRASEAGKDSPDLLCCGEEGYRHGINGNQSE